MRKSLPSSKQPMINNQLTGSPKVVSSMAKYTTERPENQQEKEKKRENGDWFIVHIQSSVNLCKSVSGTSSLSSLWLLIWVESA
jgi:hypothetical protein